jgi:hypothetical protein
MPDVANALLFQRKLTAVETAYMREIERNRREARRVMLEIMDRDGVTRAGVAAMQNQIDALKRAVVAAGSVAARDTRRVVQNYARKQIQVAQRAGLAKRADPNVLQAQTSTQASDGEQAYMTSTPAWLTTLETSLQTTAARMRISQAAPDEATKRLLSETAGDGRQSVWAASGTAAGLEEQRDLWTYGIGLLGAYLFFVNESDPEQTYQKQAIATIDERTTDCCLQVHGQIQPIDEPFILPGSPRYADEIQDPPFHWYCRTSEALYHPSFEEIGIPTETMERQAQKEITARAESKKRVPIYPSHATAQR